MATPEPCQALTATVAREWSMGYTMVYGSVRLARIHARRHLINWQWPGDVQDAVLIVSELVTNAISHGWKRGHELSLRLAVLEDGSLLIDVSDPGRAFPRFGERIESGEGDERGRGLRVVRELGGEVGWFLRQHCGKTVRVRLASFE
ncbi:ATP-binding protein [Streptomyces sp. ISL-100]|uniref:ATP-binding protein n=1 Tax=Streptomyces sp. ISL-100 TaxID=2819173 RepID=UPI001BECB4AD|nr:ATP-binding protein [Streptomyces sp. ISL-100]MBT2395597.1 ATP-binding protein [Streptomyces sp. ISL-100]